jgi:signal transduction histidine kinase
MSRITRVYYKIIIVAAVGIYIVSMLNFYFSHSLMEEHIEEYTNELALYLSSEIDSWSKMNSDLILSIDSLVAISADDDLILEFMKEKLDKSEDFMSLYYIDFERDCNINASGWVAPKNYDYSSRPWYEPTSKSNDIVISDIFLNLSKDAMIVTFTKGLFDEEGNFIGIVGGDVKTENIVRFIEKSTHGKNAYSVLVDRKNKYISQRPLNVSGINDIKHKKNMDIIIDHAIENGQADSGIYEFSKNDTKGYIKFTPVEQLGWKLLSFYPEEEYSDTFDQLRMSSSMTGIIISFITIFMGYYISKYVVKPMFEIEGQVALLDLENNRGYRLNVKNTGAFNKLVNQINDILVRAENSILYLEKEREKGKSLNHDLMNKTQEMEQFIYITSHDLRSPLVNIQGFASELEYSLESIRKEIATENDVTVLKNRMTNFYGNDINESIRFIKVSTKKMDSLLKGLMKISRVGRSIPSISKIDMGKLFLEIKGNFEYSLITQDIDLIIKAVPDCYGDYDLLNQIFSNIIENSIKNMKEEGSKTIIINGYIKGNKSNYIVMDNGIGIDKKYQKDVFKMFTKLDSSKEGEGIGLTIIQRLILKLNGTISLESEIEKGTSVFVELNNYDWRDNYVE